MNNNRNILKNSAFLLENIDVTDAAVFKAYSCEMY